MEIIWKNMLLHADDGLNLHFCPDGTKIKVLASQADARRQSTGLGCIMYLWQGKKRLWERRNSTILELPG